MSESKQNPDAEGGKPLTEREIHQRELETSNLSVAKLDNVVAANQIHQFGGAYAEHKTIMAILGRQNEPQVEAQVSQAAGIRKNDAQTMYAMKAMVNEYKVDAMLQSSEGIEGAAVLASQEKLRLMNRKGLGPEDMIEMAPFTMPAPRDLIVASTKAIQEIAAQKLEERGVEPNSPAMNIGVSGVLVSLDEARKPFRMAAKASLAGEPVATTTVPEGMTPTTTEYAREQMLEVA